VQAGYVAPPHGADDAIVLTSAGELARDRLFAARQQRIQQFLVGWDSDAHPELLRLLSRFTHELAAGDEQPGRDLEPAAHGA
jgi:hypothetical protein